MGSLQLWAVGISHVRGIFSADPVMAQRLRHAAHQHFGQASPPAPGLLGKLGPLMRRSSDPAAPRPEVPTPDDVEDMLAGRYLPPPRLPAAWALFEFWLTLLADHHVRLELSEAEIRDFDFDLARNDVPSRYSLNDLFTSNLGIMLTRPPGLADGWINGQHAADMATAWSAALATLTEPNTRIAAEIQPLLSSFNSAEPVERDLIAVFQS